jgi:mercuric reductase
VQGLAEAGYLTSTTAMELESLPQSMLVVGGNYVGLELGQLFARLGTKVTVVEALHRLAPMEEPEVSDTIADVFADEGIDVVTGAALSRVYRDNSGYLAMVTRNGEQRELRTEQLLVATGRRPQTAALGLEAVRVKLGERGEVLVDEHLRTANPRIWAVGDVTGHPQFVYVAGAHGAVVADNAFDDANRTLDYRYLPRVTFTSPNIAAVGLTDAQAVAQGLRCTCRVLPLEHVPRALVNRDTRGLVKIVAERGSGRIVGVHVIAHSAGDVIAAGVYAVKAGMTVDEMADTWSPYLTMAEGLKLAAQTFTRDVSKLSCCAS